MSDPTVGVDFFSRLVNLRAGARVKLQLWDTAGQERFRSITKSYYRNSVGAVLAYDICNMDTFKHIPVWLQEAKRHIEPHQATFILVGCKLDLAGDNREVTSQQGQALADYHSIPFMETSAKQGTNVEEAFTVISEEIYGKLERGEYKVEEISGEVGWCKLTIFEAGLSDAGVYKIVFPFEPARYNQEITVKVNQISLNQAEAISWLAIGVLAVLLVIQLFVGIVIFGSIKKLRKMSEAQNLRGERRIPLMEQMKS